MRRKEPGEEEHCFSELDSLGIHPKRKNELNDRKEMTDLVENIRETMLKEYPSAYTE